jgi:hypothetical protein
MVVAPRLGPIAALLAVLLVELPTRAVVVLVDALLATTLLQPRSIRRSPRLGGYIHNRRSCLCGRRFGSRPTLRCLPDNADDTFEIPLFHIFSTSENSDDAVQAMPIIPLPSDHLPQDNLLRRLHIYEIPSSSISTLSMPSPTLIDLLVSMPVNALPPPLPPSATLFGCLANIPQSPSPLASHVEAESTALDHGLVGAIGCAVQILDTTNDDMDTDIASSSSSIWCQGRFRFKVQRIVQSEPHTVALVTKLYDNHNVNDDDDIESAGNATRGVTTTTTDHHVQQVNPDDDNEDEYEYDTHFNALTPDELEQRTLQAMQASVNQQLAQAQERVAHPELWLLDETIRDKFLAPSSLSSSSSSSSSAQALVDAAERQLATAQEFTAAWHLFQTLLQSNIWPTPSERQYAIGIMAAELCRLDDATLRQRWLVTTNPLERLRSVCAHAERAVAWLRARQVAQSIATTKATSNVDNDQQDLTVGTPSLPHSWVRTMAAGARVEYFWNVEHGWCRGTVVSDPVYVVSEYILTVRFDDDGSTHALPLTADEKARWRPLVVREGPSSWE